jgi:hypothetical protein
MKAIGKLPSPSLTAILGDPVGNAPRTVQVVGERKRGPGRGRGLRKCGACGALGHQANSYDCPGAP